MKISQQITQLIYIIKKMDEINKQDAYTVKRTNIKTPYSDKSLQSRNFFNYLQQISQFQPPQQCNNHYSEQITHICIDCEYKCICALCLQQGMHRDHVLKNLEKGSKIADRILNQYLIRLRSKSDLLTLLKQNVAIRKNELYSQYKEYEEIIENNFKILINDINVQKQSLLIKLNRYHQKQVNKIEQTLKQIKQQSELSLKTIQYLSDRMEQLQPASLCIFFKEKKSQIQDIMDQNRQRYQKLKNTIQDIKWVVDCNIFENLRENISCLHFYQSESYIEFRNKPKNSQKKSISKSKICNQGNLSKQSITPGCITPKNYNSKIKMNNFVKNHSSKRLKKSTNSSKLISMPTSPNLISTPKHKSPKKQQINIAKSKKSLEKIDQESIKGVKFFKHKNKI